MSNPFRNTAIVGVGRTEGPFTPNRTSLQLHAEVSRKAILNGRLRLADIDGVLTAGTDYPTYCERSGAGLCSATCDATVTWDVFRQINARLPLLRPKLYLPYWALQSFVVL